MLSICDILTEKIPKDTRIFCGHEYAVSNLKFCQEVLKEEYQPWLDKFRDLE
jgi:hypothetical protein